MFYLVNQIYYGLEQWLWDLDKDTLNPSPIWSFVLNEIPFIYLEPIKIKNKKLYLFMLIWKLDIFPV